MAFMPRGNRMAPAAAARLSPVAPQVMSARNDPAMNMNRMMRRDRSKMTVPRKGIGGLAGGYRMSFK